MIGTFLGCLNPHINWVSSAHLALLSVKFLQDPAHLDREVFLCTGQGPECGDLCGFANNCGMEVAGRILTDS